MATSLSNYPQSGEWKSAGPINTVTPDLATDTTDYRAVRGVVTGVTGTSTGTWEATSSPKADINATPSTAVYETDTRGVVSLAAGRQDVRDFVGVRGLRFRPDAANTGTYTVNVYILTR